MPTFLLINPSAQTRKASRMRAGMPIGKHETHGLKDLRVPEPQRALEIYEDIYTSLPKHMYDIVHRDTVQSQYKTPLYD